MVRGPALKASAADRDPLVRLATLGRATDASAAARRRRTLGLGVALFLFLLGAGLAHTRRGAAAAPGAGLATTPPAPTPGRGDGGGGHGKTSSGGNAVELPAGDDDGDDGGDGGDDGTVDDAAAATAGNGDADDGGDDAAGDDNDGDNNGAEREDDDDADDGGAEGTDAADDDGGDDTAPRGTDDGNGDATDDTTPGAAPDNDEDRSSEPPEIAHEGDERDWAWLEAHEAIPPLDVRDFSPPVLLERFREARQALLAQLAADYGADAAAQMFLRGEDGATVGRTILGSADRPSWARVRRKLVMKVLHAQIRATRRRHRRRNMRWNRRLAERKVDEPRMVPFIWAVGGHSAAAAHGNYYNQSYAAQLERAGRAVFRAAGLHLVGRNYAMGGTSSGLEVGACVDQIFGLDIDALSWDFGMTDGRNLAIFENYFSHAALAPNRPAMVAIHAESGRCEVMDQLEANGLPTLCLAPAELNQVNAAVPDTLGKSQAEIDQMPPFVQYFKCENNLESGEPGCGEQKFSSDHCLERKFRTSWHPGWKYHGMIGNLLALALTEMLEDALKFLEEKETYDAEQLLRELEAEEDEDYKTFFTSDILDVGKELVPTENGLDPKRIMRNRPMCRTCRLPAQSRYLGVMTETPVGGMLHYPMGISFSEAMANANEEKTMRLVWEGKDRQVCEVPLNQDYKDYYIVTAKDKWQYLSIPNDQEAKYYATGVPRSGVIMVTMPGCDWGQCPTGELREDAYAEGKIDMEINGIKVTNVTVANGAHFVFHGDNNLIFPPNDHGRYEIRVMLNAEEGSFVRFSAFTIW